MNRATRRIAVSGMMVALCTVILLMGGVIPAATFCGPALAGLLLIPVYIEGGQRMALGAWLAASALGLMLCADKEAALLFAFLGYYPVLKWRLERIASPGLRVAAKALVMGGAVAAMYALIFFVLRLDQVLADFAELSRAMLIVTVLLGAVTLALYDRMLTLFSIVYLKRIRPRLNDGRKNR